ncbi:MAG: hypothetical protein LBQ60_05060 [Bacteroidales bacterium]|jgi:hypothetical protein|nr:hypothetical protein [Bacteroidales bacterium]
MGKDILYERFVEAIKNKVPERGQLVNSLADILLIEKDAIYRRLRGEVLFTFAEITKISKKIGISLDHITGEDELKNYSFTLHLNNYENPDEEDYRMQEHYINMLDNMRGMPGSEVGAASNMIPTPLYIPYEYIYRFYLLKWMYQLGDRPKKFSEIQIPQRQMEIGKRALAFVKNVSNTHWVMNENFLVLLINDINYFINIKYITEDEAKLLKKDISCFIDYLDEIATTGCFETGKKIFLYISSLNFESSYSYVESQNYFHTAISSFTLNDAISLNIEVLKKIKKWMKAIIQTSIMISESATRQRVLFFTKQRDIIATNL